MEGKVGKGKKEGSVSRWLRNEDESQDTTTSITTKTKSISLRLPSADSAMKTFMRQLDLHLICDCEKFANTSMEKFGEDHIKINQLMRFIALSDKKTKQYCSTRSETLVFKK